MFAKLMAIMALVFCPNSQFIPNLLSGLTTHWVFISISVGRNHLWIFVAPLVENLWPHLESVTTSSLEYPSVQDGSCGDIEITPLKIVALTVGTSSTGVERVASTCLVIGMPDVAAWVGNC